MALSETDSTVPVLTLFDCAGVEEVSVTCLFDHDEVEFDSDTSTLLPRIGDDSDNYGDDGAGEACVAAYATNPFTNDTVDDAGCDDASQTSRASLKRFQRGCLFVTTMPWNVFGSTESSPPAWTNENIQSLCQYPVLSDGERVALWRRWNDLWDSCASPIVNMAKCKMAMRGWWREKIAWLRTLFESAGFCVSDDLSTYEAANDEMLCVANAVDDIQRNDDASRENRESRCILNASGFRRWTCMRPVHRRVMNYFVAAVAHRFRTSNTSYVEYVLMLLMRHIGALLRRLYGVRVANMPYMPYTMWSSDVDDVIPSCVLLVRLHRYLHGISTPYGHGGHRTFSLVFTCTGEQQEPPVWTESQTRLLQQIEQRRVCTEYVDKRGRVNVNPRIGSLFSHWTTVDAALLLFLYSRCPDATAGQIAEAYQSPLLTACFFAQLRSERVVPLTRKTTRYWGTNVRDDATYNNVYMAMSVALDAVFAQAQSEDDGANMATTVSAAKRYHQHEQGAAAAGAAAAAAAAAGEHPWRHGITFWRLVRFLLMDTYDGCESMVDELLSHVVYLPIVEHAAAAFDEACDAVRTSILRQASLCGVQWLTLR